MAIDVSKQVANYLAQTREVVSSVEIHGPQLVDPLLKELAKFASVAGFDPAIIFKICVDYLNGLANAMRDADIALAQERNDDPEIRDKRDNSIASMLKTITKAKSVLNESALLAYGLSSRTPVTPDAVVNYGKKIIALIKEKPEVVNEKAADEEDFVKVDVDSMIQKLTKGVTDIDQALTDVKREERELQAAINFRDEKMEEWKNGFFSVAPFLASLYQLAGNTEQADRIRPAMPRKSSKEEPEPEPSPQKVEEKTKA